MRTLVRWNPANQNPIRQAPAPRACSEFEREFHGLFNWALGEPNAEGHFSPATDLVEESDRYRIDVDLPGLKKEDIEVSFKEGVLTVRGERTSVKNQVREIAEKLDSDDQPSVEVEASCSEVGTPCVEGDTIPQATGRFVRQERFVGSFERRFRFRSKVDSSRMEAKFEDGVLRLVVPFLPEVQPLRLTIS